MNWVCQWNSHQLERRMTMLLFGLAHIQEESRYIMILNGKSGAPSYVTKSNPSHPSLLIPTYPTYPPLDWDVLDRIDPGWMTTRQRGILCLACATQTQPNGMKIKGNCKILCWMRNLRVPQPIPEVVIGRGEPAEHAYGMRMGDKRKIKELFNCKHYNEYSRWSSLSISATWPSSSGIAVKCGKHPQE